MVPGATVPCAQLATTLDGVNEPVRARPVVVICPMAIEAEGLRSALRRDHPDVLERVEIRVCGIGGEAVARAVRMVRGVGAMGGEAAGGSVPALVVLAGTAGGLTEGPPAPRIGFVVHAETGRRFTPTAVAPPEPGTGAGLEAGSSDVAVGVLGVDRLIDTPGEKRALHARFGTPLVDMESHAFAEACERAGLAWAVVRGVSDGPDDHLPGYILGWFNADGTSRPWRMVRDALLHPWQIPALIRTGRRTRTALRAAGGRLAGLVRGACGAGPVTPA